MVFDFDLSFVFFNRKHQSKQKEFFIFLMLCLFALVLNALGMWLLVSIIGIYYLYAKIFVTGAVMVWNFISRKSIFEAREGKQ